MLNGFGTIVNQLGKRVKPYLPQICGTILWRLNNKSAKVRQQAADLISRIAVVMKTCQEVYSFLLLSNLILKGFYISFIACVLINLLTININKSTFDYYEYCQYLSLLKLSIFPKFYERFPHAMPTNIGIFVTTYGI